MWPTGIVEAERLLRLVPTRAGIVGDQRSGGQGEPTAGRLSAAYQTEKRPPLGLRRAPVEVAGPRCAAGRSRPVGSSPGCTSALLAAYDVGVSRTRHALDKTRPRRLALR